MDAEDGPTVPILLLGDPSCGKSTFLAKLSQGPSSLSRPVTPANPLPILRDFDQPFVYQIRMYNRPYRFEFYDTSSPDNYTLLRPSVILICYDVCDRRTLDNARDLWSEQAARTWLADKEDIVVALVGLKRDLRTEGNEMVVDPLRGHQVAQELRCDLYAECSAMTGELMSEVFEDVARKAAKTTTEAGGLSQGGCALM